MLFPLEKLSNKTILTLFIFIGSVFMLFRNPESLRSPPDILFLTTDSFWLFSLLKCLIKAELLKTLAKKAYFAEKFINETTFVDDQKINDKITEPIPVFLRTVNSPKVSKGRPPALGNEARSEVTGTVEQQSGGPRPPAGVT